MLPVCRPQEAWQKLRPTACSCWIMEPLLRRRPSLYCEKFAACKGISGARLRLLPQPRLLLPVPSPHLYPCHSMPLHSISRIPAPLLLNVMLPQCQALDEEGLAGGFAISVLHKMHYCQCLSCSLSLVGVPDTCSVRVLQTSKLMFGMLLQNAVHSARQAISIIRLPCCCQVW